MGLGLLGSLNNTEVSRRDILSMFGAVAVNPQLAISRIPGGEIIKLTEYLNKYPELRVEYFSALSQQLSDIKETIHVPTFFGNKNISCNDVDLWMQELISLQTQHRIQNFYLEASDSPERLRDILLEGLDCCIDGSSMNQYFQFFEIGAKDVGDLDALVIVSSGYEREFDGGYIEMNCSLDPETGKIKYYVDIIKDMEGGWLDYGIRTYSADEVDGIIFQPEDVLLNSVSRNGRFLKSEKGRVKEIKQDKDTQSTPLKDFLMGTTNIVPIEVFKNKFPKCIIDILD